MKPRKISVAILSQDEILLARTRKLLADEALVDIAGGYSDICALSNAHVQFDVVITWFSEGEERLRTLKFERTKLIVLAPNRFDIDVNGDLTDYIVYTQGAHGDYSEKDLSAKLIYQIRRARLALSAEQQGTAIKAKAKAHFTETDARDKSEEPIQAKQPIKLIAIGASAGGTEAIMSILPLLPADMPPILLVQHMPARFISLFAGRLRDNCRMEVCLATGGEIARRGVIYLTELDKHMTIEKQDGALVVNCSDGERVSGARPSVDCLFLSAAAIGKDAIGVILTGMGTDGAEGLSAMRRAGAYTIGQDEKSCVVYGMPCAAFKRGAVARQMPLSAIAGDLIGRVRKSSTF